MVRESILNKRVSSNDGLTYDLLKAYLNNNGSYEDKWEELGDDESEEDDDDERNELGDDDDTGLEEVEIEEEDDDIDNYAKIRGM